MKVIRHIIVVSIFSSLNINAQNVGNEIETLKGEYMFLNDSLSQQRLIIDSLELRIENLENSIIQKKLFSSDRFVNLSGLLIGIASILFTIFLAFIGFITFYRFKTLKKTINKKIIQIKKNAKDVFEVKKKILSNQNYLKHAIELYSTLFGIFGKNLNKKKGADFIELKVYETQSIINLYSPLRQDRFSSITYLYGRGTFESLEHLEGFVNNPEEEKDLILLALKAIDKIKAREQV